MRIFEYALAPTGYICSTSTKTTRFSINPKVAPALLATCRQIHEEAKHLLFEENRICIRCDAHETAWPSIAESRLPQHVLERIQHLYVVLDCTSRFFRASFADVDWTAFSALTSLKSIRIAVLRHCSTHYSHSQHFHPEYFAESMDCLLREILHRIPAGAVVEYGALSADLRQFTENILESGCRREGGIEMREIDAEDIGAVAATMDVQQGCQSGGIEDVFAEYHEAARRSYRVPDMAV